MRRRAAHRHHHEHDNSKRHSDYNRTLDRAAAMPASRVETTAFGTVDRQDAIIARET